MWGRLYRHHDVHGGGFIEIDQADAPKWNSSGNGIFHACQTFDGPRRIEFLKDIRWWMVDLDKEPKPQQRARIARSPLRPSLVVETARGHHVYWRALRASYEAWHDIVRDRLVPYFQADPNARDVTRVLRTPGYWHLKDPANPFLVRVVLETRAAYTEAMMLREFAPIAPQSRHIRATPHQSSMRHVRQPSNAIGATSALGTSVGIPPTERGSERGSAKWEAIYARNQGELLLALSGRCEIGYDIITLKLNSNGTQQIWCNGRSTGCWIDHRGRIGSHANGGPSVVEWAGFYGTSKRKLIEALEELGEIKK